MAVSLLRRALKGHEVLTTNKKLRQLDRAADSTRVAFARLRLGRLLEWDSYLRLSDSDASTYLMHLAAHKVLTEEALEVAALCQHKPARLALSELSGAIHATPPGESILGCCVSWAQTIFGFESRLGAVACLLAAELAEPYASRALSSNSRRLFFESDWTWIVYGCKEGHPLPSHWEVWYETLKESGGNRTLHWGTGSACDCAMLATLPSGVMEAATLVFDPRRISADTVYARIALPITKLSLAAGFSDVKWPPEARGL